MVDRKRRKFSRQRGNTSHGWGAKKKHRGKGHKGGAGMAGTGKRADTKKPVIWKDTKYFGKHGFKKKGQKKEEVCINLSALELKLDTLLADKKVSQDGEAFLVDLGSLGFTKLLGAGKAGRKMKITVANASAKAKAKVEEAGGSVNA